MARNIYVGGKPRWYEILPVSPALLAAALAVLVLGGGIWGVSSILAQGEPDTSDPDVGAVLSEPSDAPAVDVPAVEEPSLALDPASVDAASSAADINLFSALDATSELLDSSQVAAVEDAIGAIASYGYRTGFVVLDLSTGKGVGYNADDEFFCASTVKAPFAAYVYQNLIDPGEISVSEVLEKDVEIGGTGVMLTEDKTEYELEEVLADAIVYSDNIAYAMLREHYEGPAWDEWTVAAGVEQGVSVEGYYPFCSAKDLAQYWIAVQTYLESQSAGAQSLKNLLGTTEVSFLREALGSRASVYAKAGFEVDSENGDLGAINDAGIVSGPSGDYLIAVMSDIDYDSEWLTDNAWLIVDLIEALDDLHTAVLAA
ncbi:serine hydrolase [Raoultibacter phocaeensis]|uniref:serine hydrolase n=1 Tax=Raoultibacter phocaeensis TaxID=2479841 RepID=UPI0015D5CBC5|nr:serine hydrolase [Raoultibacter phocaeensis]